MEAYLKLSIIDMTEKREVYRLYGLRIGDGARVFVGFHVNDRQKVKFLSLRVWAEEG